MWAVRDLDQARRSELVADMLDVFGYAPRRATATIELPSFSDPGRIDAPTDRGVRRSPMARTTRPVGIWVCREYRQRSSVEIDVPALPSGELLVHEPSAAPDPTPVLGAAEMMNLWDNALADVRHGAGIDVAATVRRLAEAAPLESLPALRRTAFTTHVTVILDRRDRLRPMWPDQLAFFSHLERLVGELQCRMLSLPDGARGPLLDEQRFDELGEADWPEAGVVLVISDFDRISPGAASKRAIDWDRWLRRMCGRGNRVITIGPSGPGPSARVIHFGVFARDPITPAVDALFAAMSGAHRPDTARLRHLRTALATVCRCGLAEELAVWNHADSNYVRGPRWAERAGCVGSSLARFAALPPVWRVALDRALHESRAFLHEDVAELEALKRASANLEAPPSGDAFAKVLHRARAGEHGRRMLDGWLASINSLLCEIAPGYATDPRFVPLFQEAQLVAQRFGLPQPFGPSYLERQAGASSSFVQSGADLMFNGPERPLSPVWRGRGPWLDAASRRVLAAETRLTGGEYTVESSAAVVTLVRESVPIWAESFWRDGSGVHAAHSNGVTLRLIEAGADAARARWVVVDGRWPWASDAGVDAYGLWTQFAVEGVTQRLRWIPPGEFLMGSEARPGDEPLHRVTLTEGYWLAETACTQALWKVVMGENPSRFEGTDRPVEQVSWDEVQAFCTKMRERLRGFEARLPTEAEWEYAARAGTRTAFWWGNELTTTRANYNGNYPYPEDGEKGEYRQETVEVKAFEPNPWGLYQMHGNVYEWCQDWFGQYPKGEQVNPTGPENGVRRVLRGGSWIDYGRFLRADYRVHRVPGYRFDLLGFRVAAGQLSDRPGSSASRAGFWARVRAGLS